MRDKLGRFMKGGKPWNKKYDEKAIIDLYLNGNSINDISKIIGCHFSTAYDILKKNNILIMGSTYFNRIKLKGRKCGKMDEKTKEKISNKKSKMYQNGEIIPYWLDKKRTEDTKNKIRKTKIKQHIIPSNVFKIGFKQKLETKIKIGLASKEHWANPEYAEKVITNSLKALLKRPTSFEKKIAELCIENSLPFVYTGNGQFLINFKNPDFVNHQDKVVIEVFYSWFKIRDYGSVENYKEFCRQKYNSAGWKVIFIDENEVNIDNWKELCLNKIMEFIK